MSDRRRLNWKPDFQPSERIGRFWKIQAYPDHPTIPVLGEQLTYHLQVIEDTCESSPVNSRLTDKYFV